MQTFDLVGRSLALTALTFGGGPLGGMYTPLDDATAFAALAAAWDAGIRSYDTAPHYGIGHSERRLGEFLRGKPRDEYVLSTKVGRLLVPKEPPYATDDGFEVPATHRRVWDFTADGVRRSLDESLTRLAVDRVDVVYLHDADDHLDEAVAQAAPALAALRDEGVVTAIGAGMNAAAPLARLVRECDLDVVLFANQYNLLDQLGFDDLFPACAERDVSVVIGAPFASGLLARERPAPDATYLYAPAAAHLVARVHRIADIAASYGVTVPQLALAFPFAAPSVVSVAAGMRSAAEVEANVHALHADIPAACWQELRAAGLLDPRAPVPTAGA